MWNPMKSIGIMGQLNFHGLLLGPNGSTFNIPCIPWSPDAMPARQGLTRMTHNLQLENGCVWKFRGRAPQSPTFDGSFDGLSSYSPLKMTIWMGKPCLPHSFRHAQIWILPRSRSGFTWPSNELCPALGLQSCNAMVAGISPELQVAGPAMSAKLGSKGWFTSEPLKIARFPISLY